MIFLSEDFKELVVDPTGSLSPVYRVVEIPKSCGANIIVSKAKFPPTTDAFLKKHKKEGSVFITLVDEFIDRDAVVSKAVEFDAGNKIVVYLGSMSAGCGYIKVSGLLNMPEREYIEDRVFYAMLGFAFMECSHACLDHLLQLINERVESEKPVSVLPSYSDGTIAEDWRKTVATLPLIGLERARYLWSRYKGRPLLDVLVDLTDLNMNDKGIAKVIAQQIRDYIGIPEGFSLWLKHESEE